MIRSNILQTYSHKLHTDKMLKAVTIIVTFYFAGQLLFTLWLYIRKAYTIVLLNYLGWNDLVLCILNNMLHSHLYFVCVFGCVLV